jgi:hypothetical protein
VCWRNKAGRSSMEDFLIDPDIERAFEHLRTQPRGALPGLGRRIVVERVELGNNLRWMFSHISILPKHWRVRLGSVALSFADDGSPFWRLKGAQRDEDILSSPDSLSEFDHRLDAVYGRIIFPLVDLGVDVQDRFMA